MKKLGIGIIGMVGIFSLVHADEYDINLSKVNPMCGTYLITESSTREQVLKNCTIIDKHSGMVRLFRGSQKVDLVSTNMGNITCKFRMSAVNYNGSIKSCITTTPPITESAIITEHIKESEIRTK